MCLERILDKRIRTMVEEQIEEEQQGFRRGKGTSDGLFSLRQLVEKKLEVKGSMVLSFVDLEKAYCDTVPMELVMSTLRWMGVPEAEFRMIEGLYDSTKGTILNSSMMSDEFGVNIGLRHSALCQLFFTCHYGDGGDYRKVSTNDVL